MHGFYSWLMRLAQPWLWLKLAWRARLERGYWHAPRERFGRYGRYGRRGTDSANASPRPGAIWLHAVSLGETRAAAALLQALRAQMPQAHFLLTHGTATGWAEGKALLKPGDYQTWLPWDAPAAVARFLDHFQPRLGLLMETEVWPNLVRACQQRGLPLALVNARMSERSTKRALALSSLSGPTYAGLAAVWAQTEDDATRLRRLGATVQAVLGNVKFDATPDTALCQQGRAWRASGARPVLMLASSRAGEEQALVRALVQRRRSSASAGGNASAVRPTTVSPVVATAVQYLIVPRHPQRFDEVANLVQAAGLTVSRRSAWQNGPEAADVWLGDSLGEMALYYSLAEVALLGGSFERLGGQNLIEAAACGCPLVLGPHTFNFAEAAELALSAGAAQRVADMEQALDCALVWLGNPAALRQAAQQAQTFSAQHRGAATRTAQAAVALLGQTRDLRL